MKKLIFSFSAIALLLTSCSNDGEIGNSDLNNTESSRIAAPTVEHRNCSAMEVLDAKIQADPGLEARMNKIEKFTYNYENHVEFLTTGKKPNNPGNSGGGGGSDPTPYVGTVNIPVVVHVIYSNSQENISDAQIQSQIDVLNEDYSATNSDFGNIPSEFAGVAVDADVNFTLSAVTRKSSSVTEWGYNDAMKHTSQGGVDAWDTTQYLNMWVCNIGGGILGYAQFPGGDASTDGVVIGPNFFGRVGYLSVPFDGGRTASHEVGHWLNLRHIWGDGRCNRDDFVTDTPTSDRANYGCPSYPTVHCRNNDMTMNYMDYVDDDCMYMFTEGQNLRMRALFAVGGARETFVQ